MPGDKAILLGRIGSCRIHYGRVESILFHLLCSFFSSFPNLQVEKKVSFPFALPVIHL